MRCEEIRTQLSALLDGELSPPAREAVARHVEACGRCALFLEELSRVTRFLDRSSVPEKVDLADEIMAAVKAEAVRPAVPVGRRAARVPGWILAAAAVVLFCLVIRNVWVTPPPVDDSVGQVVATAGSLFSDVGRAFVDAGRGVTAASEAVAGDAKGLWLAMADESPAARITDMVGQGREILSGDLGEVSAMVGRLFSSTYEIRR